MNSLTPSQAAAIAARGNILLEAGAGAGKTSTMVARCLAQLLADSNPISVDELLMVTFTDAAAAEMRRRIREALNRRSDQEPANLRIAEQLALLDHARIGTLHGFCFRLVRDHFHELGLDPQSQVLDEGEAKLLAKETAREVIDRHFQSESSSGQPVLELIRLHGDGDAQRIEALVVSLHHHLQTLPEPGAWLEREERAWAKFDRTAWEHALVDEFRAAQPSWLEQLSNQPVENEIAHRCARLLIETSEAPTRTQVGELTHKLAAFREDEHWKGNKGKHRDPILTVLDEAATLASLATVTDSGDDALADDFALMQAHVLALLGLVREFGTEFAARKRQRAGLDFSDLEQFSLRLLWVAATQTPTATAGHWRERFKAVFVDEYQDINEAQDRIIAAISRDGAAANRFLVGDVKQSIYGFRLARPDIFLRYARIWRAAGAGGQVLPLSDNFRSHEAILAFVNHCFAALMREDMGGIGYPPEAHLQFGDPAGRAVLSRAYDAKPRVEFCLRLTASRRTASEADETEAASAVEENTNAENEALLVAARLRQLKEAGFQIFDRESKSLRAVEWRDMAVLLRATSGKAEIYARAFARAGLPLAANRRGFFDALEISDLVSLFMLIDNPQQDLPLLAVLRSPLVGLTPEETVAIRLAAPAERSYWSALNRHQELRTQAPDAGFRKGQKFLDAFHRWRVQARRGSLSQCLEDILDATHYLDWLATQPRGHQQMENVQRLLELTRRYDSWQGRGLHRFLEYVRLIDADGDGPEPAAPPANDAVRLMTIHASKGLEFPVVVLADLNKPFRDDSPAAGFFVDDELGLCPAVIDPARAKEYSSLKLLAARRRQRLRLLAEELRLLYVAMTRACDRLILLGTVGEKRPEKEWSIKLAAPLSRLQISAARSPMDLLGPLLPGICEREDWHQVGEGSSHLITWRIIGSDERIEASAVAIGRTSTTAPPPSPPELAGLNERLAFRYPFLQATRRSGKTTVTRIRRQIADSADPESNRLFEFDQHPTTRSNSSRLSAAEIGVAHHTYFQNLNLGMTTSMAELALEAERLVATGLLTEAERRSLKLEHVFQFWKGEVGRSIRERPTEVHRELEFTIALPAGELDEFAGRPEPVSTDLSSTTDPVIVQGIVDLAVISQREIWIIDYKTDQVAGAAVAERARKYQPQVELYRRALERIYQRPVTGVWLHFLHPGITVPMAGFDAGRSP